MHIFLADLYSAHAVYKKGAQLAALFQESRWNAMNENERKFQEIIDDIIAYLEMLNRHYHVSVHGIDSMLGPYLNRFLPYNTHNSAMCIYVKNSTFQMKKRCLRCQHIAIDYAQRHGDYCGTCFFGMTEYVYAVPLQDNQCAVVCVSGYRLPTPELMHYIQRAADQFDLDRDMLLKTTMENQTDIPNADCLRVLIRPLVHMLTLLSHHMIHLKPKSSSYDSTRDGFYGRVLSYLNANYRKDISMKQLAHDNHCSISYLSHMFKTRNGLSIRAYINVLRLRDATVYLTATDLPVSEIAYTLGFSDSNYFSTVFRKELGCSPSAYRKLHGQKG